MAAIQVLNIARVCLVTADPAGAAAFYAEALGFTREPGDGAGPVLLHLGGRTLELIAAQGAPYPSLRAADDPWFQHFAIVVSDMDAAYARLSRFVHGPISRGGPQLLPPSTGSVTAYKFRDPEGHPLELSHIPGSAWTAAAAEANPFLGVDHSAVAVRDLEASVAFYTEVLGFSVLGRGLNQGPEQDRLDGLDGTALDIVSLGAPQAGPHIELLHYRTPGSVVAPVDIAPGDVAATRLVLTVDEAWSVAARLGDAGLTMMDVEGRALLHDPDGHLLELV